MIKERKSGILLHPTSFPSNYGIGDFGIAAYNFVDFLYNTKQKLWQVLPMGPVNNSFSPYQSMSAFAGNYWLISLEKLVEIKLLKKTDLAIQSVSPNGINYSYAKKVKLPLLRKAYHNFKEKNDMYKFNEFCETNAYWLNDYSRFIACDEYINKNCQKDLFLFNHFNGLSKDIYIDEFCDNFSWNAWPSLFFKGNELPVDISKKLADNILFHKFLQYIFYNQWMEIKKYANNKGIKIIGDIPMYMPLHSSDVWADPKLFMLDDDYRPLCFAGCAPDDGCPTGQSFGNCTYNWNYNRLTKYSWWIKRFKFALQIADYIRLDYFTGYENYWAIPFGEKNPSKGTFCQANGNDFFEKVLEEIDGSSIIVEDIGTLKQEVVDLRNKFKFPSMKIMQFSYDNFRTNANLPHNLTNTNCVLYTGTHDNNTILGWYKALDNKTKKVVLDLFGEEKINWALIKFAYSSIANFVIVPMQDILGLDEQYRMNVPCVVNGSWVFQYDKSMLDERITKKLKQITYLYNR